VSEVHMNKKQQIEQLFLGLWFNDPPTSFPRRA